MLWGLTDDDGFAECHDRAVDAAIEMIEKCGSTTRIRSNGTRLHPETRGLTIGVFRQSTSRADDPQLHTHVVISSKVQTADGRWYALDGRVLKRHQQAFGYLYQSALRAEMTARYGVVFDDIVNGQAEIAGVPVELLHQFSKRAHDIAIEMDHRVAEFIERTGREPSDREYSAMEREASGDTRADKTGLGADQLRTRWTREAATLGIDATSLVADVSAAAHRQPIGPSTLSVDEVLETLAARQSTWNRLDVLRVISGAVSPQPGHDATTWTAALERAVDTVLDACIDLDPAGDTGPRRRSDGRSVHVEPVAAQATSEFVLAQEERIITWALDAQTESPTPSTTIADSSLDPGQHDAATAVAGHDRLVLVVGPAGAGKTRMLAAATNDLARHTRTVVALAPTAKAAHVLASETGAPADTIAKFLHDLDHPRPTARWHDPGPGATVIVDEAGMVNTADLARLIDHTERRRWRLVLVGDPHQLQPVGRGGMFNELCTTARTIELDAIHRFHHPWEADTSLLLRAGDTRCLDAYRANDRIRAGTLDDHLHQIAADWLHTHAIGETLSITTTRNTDVDTINTAIQTARVRGRELDPNTTARTASGLAMVGDVVATRLNDRRLRTSAGDSVRNRDRWTITNTQPGGEVTVTRLDGHGTVTLPADYVRQHLELAYATTEHGAQGHTADHAITLTTDATTGRNLYVGMTRGSATNLTYVATDTNDLAEAITMLETAMAIDRADIPATTHRRTLASIPRPTITPRAEVPDWFDALRADAERALETVQQKIDQRQAKRDERAQRVEAAQRDLPAAEAAHAPFRHDVMSARGIEQEAHAALRAARADERRAGRLGRRAARRAVATATAVHADATEELNAAQLRAEPTRSRLERLHAVIDTAKDRNGIEYILDRWDDLDAKAARASELCIALDRWKDWADGHHVDREELADVALALGATGSPDAAQLAAWLRQYEGLDAPTTVRRTPTRADLEIGFEL